MDSVISIKTSRAVLSFEKDFDDIAAMRKIRTPEDIHRGAPAQATGETAASNRSPRAGSAVTWPVAFRKSLRQCGPGPVRKISRSQVISPAPCPAAAG